MPNYDLPKKTPAEVLADKFAAITAEGLEPQMTVSRSLDAVADAIRLHAHDPEAIFELAQSLSGAAFDIATVAAIAPAPKKTTKKAATPTEDEATPEG